jgi:biopolymer transport protein ExbD
MISFSRIRSRTAVPDITPLLDVVFILLIFFVVSTVFTAKGMDMELPSADSSTPVYGKSMEIELRENGDLLCDTQPISSDALSNRLRVTAALPFEKQPQNILFKAAPHADVESFVRVVDMVRTHGFSNLVIVTRTRNAPLEPGEGQ